MIDIVPFDEGQALLDWIGLTDAIAEGHNRPKAEIADTFLYRGDDTLLTRSAWIDGLGIAVKAATIFPKNNEKGLRNVNGAMNLMSDVTGDLEAVVDFGLVTKWKTAGDSLLAARRLARPESENIVIIGAGTVAASLREAYGVLFPNARFTIAGRRLESASALAAQYPATEATTDVEAAVRAADIVTCATPAKQIVLKGEWLHAGQHVDLIGAFRPDLREADTEALLRSRVFMDSRDTVLHDIGELRIPIEAGEYDPANVVADYYTLDAFTRAPDDITLFKNGGGAHLDLMTARYILDRWRAR